MILIRVKETISLRERSGMAENHGFDGNGLSLASAEPLARLVDRPNCWPTPVDSLILYVKTHHSKESLREEAYLNIAAFLAK